MIEASSPDINFDRVTGDFAVPNFLNLLHLRAMQVSSSILAPIGYFGISKVHALLGRLSRLQNNTCVTENSFRFSYPSNDYYWNRMLDSRWQYEPEINGFLTSIGHVPFAFIDLGANFGYWSARVGANLYGPHLSIAVEPSEFAFLYLELNSKNLKNEVRIHQLAIDQKTGERIRLYGSRHAGLSITDQWPGANANNSISVDTISIDKLVEQENLQLKTTPLVIKLDVEGAELRAIRGAVNVLNSDSVFIVEDAEKNVISESISIAFNELGCNVYLFQNGSLGRVRSLDEIIAHKRATRTIQMMGLNLIVTKSAKWIKIIDNLE